MPSARGGRLLDLLDCAYLAGTICTALRPVFAFAIVSPASFVAWISPSARLYSFGNTLTKRARESAQWSRISRARRLPVHLWCASIIWRSSVSSASPLCQTERSIVAACSSAVRILSRLTIAVLQRLANWPSSS